MIFPNRAPISWGMYNYIYPLYEFIFFNRSFVLALFYFPDTRKKNHFSDVGFKFCFVVVMKTKHYE
jgi:hypothetical protein